MLLLLTLTTTFAAPKAKDAPAPAAVAPEKAPGGGSIYGSPRFRHADDVADVAIDAEDRELWVLTSEELTRWSLPDGKKQDTLPTPCPDGWSSALALSADAKKLAVGCDYGDIRIIDRKGHTLTTVPGDATYLAFSDDGAVLGALRDEEVRWVDLASGQVIERMPVDYDASWDQHGGLWAVAGVASAGATDTGVGSGGGYYEEGDEVVVLQPGKGVKWRKRMPYAQRVAFSTDGKQLGVLASERVRTLKPSSGERIVGRPLDLDYAYQLVPTDSGWWVATEDTIARLDTKLERKGVFKGVTEWLVASPSGKFLVDVDGARPRVYTSDGTDLTGADGLSARADQVRVHGDVLAAVNYSSAMITSRSSGRTAVHPLYGADRVDIAPDGSHVAFGAGDELLLATADGKVREVAGLGDLSSLGMVGFSADSKKLYLVWGGYDELYLTVVDVADAKAAKRQVIDGAPSYTAGGVQLSDDRSMLVIPRDDGRVLVKPL